MKTPLVSVVIPARNEFPNIVHTVYSLINDLETFLSPAEFEIIICANCIDDWHLTEKDRRAIKGTVDYLMPMGAYANRVIRVIYDPIAGNHSTRNKGALLARGKYLFMSDAHMSYKVGYFKRMIRAIDETKGIVHGAIGWLGAYPPSSSTGYQYTIKLGDEIRGTWNNYLLADDYFYIPLQGHCCLGVDRKQFLEFGGYPEYHRCYGGGEFYLDMKWWMFGSNVVVDPQAIAYHLRSSRGYSYNYNDLIHNIFLIGHSLGIEEWAERSYLNWLRKGNKETLDRLWNEAEKEAQKDKEFIAKKKVKTFNELIVERPWDKLNDEKYGRHNSAMSIFHDSWLPLIKGTPAEEPYNNSELQKNLEKFINEKLSDYVFRRNTREITQAN